MNIPEEKLYWMYDLLTAAPSGVAVLYSQEGEACGIVQGTGIGVCMQKEILIEVENPVCTDCKYYGGCERTGNCDTTCDKWDVSSLMLEDLLEDLSQEEQQAIAGGAPWKVVKK
ncbi:MAG: hypothetical protein ACI4DV_01220 [Lachnospiraceae bacterium]